jgi:hypothetical protein
MNPKFRQWLTSNRTIIKSTLATVLFFLANFLQHSKSHSRSGNAVYSICYLFAFILVITSLPPAPSYKREFKQPISPFTFYAVKTTAIVITVILIIGLSILSYFCVAHYCSLLNMKFQIAIHATGLVTAVILAALFGEYIQRLIFNRIDRS